jgi:alanyl-tRNA synthetase
VATNYNNKPQIAVAVGDEVAKQKDYHAGQWVKQLAVHIKGGGGGQPQFAMAGGKDVNGLDKALAAAKELL